MARTLCLWTDKLPEDRREDADKILADGAVSGLGHLAGQFAEIYERYRAEEPDEDKDESFEDRALRLVTTLGGAGVLHGDLSPECAAATIISSIPPGRGCDLRFCVMDMSTRSDLALGAEQKSAATRGLAQVTRVTPPPVRRGHPPQITVSTARLRGPSPTWWTPENRLEITVQAVLDALSAPADAEDTRTREQRCHDIRPYDQEEPPRTRGTPPTRRDSRAANHGQAA